LHVRILSDPDFISGNIGTGFMDRFLSEPARPRGAAAAS